MLEERAFHLGRVHLVAAAVNHVFLPIEHIDKTLGVYGSDVARTPEPGGEFARGRHGVVPVAAHHHGPLDPELAWLAGRNLAPRVIHHANFAAAYDAPDAVAVTRGLMRRHHRRWRSGLGRAVKVHQAEVGKLFGEARDRRRRHRRAAVAADAPAPQVVALEIGLAQA